MRVRVRLFAALCDLAGAHEVEVEAPEGATVGRLVDLLDAKFGGFRAELAGGGPAYVVLVNGRAVGWPESDAELRDGDTVAFVPLIEGG